RRRCQLVVRARWTSSRLCDGDQCAARDRDSAAPDRAARPGRCRRSRRSNEAARRHAKNEAVVTGREEMTDANKARVGVVGAGRMGLAMLKPLRRHGHPVVACDVDDKQLAKAREAGATAVKAPADVARAADFVIIAVGYDDEVNAVALGAEGLIV